MWMLKLWIWYVNSESSNSVDFAHTCPRQRLYTCAHMHALIMSTPFNTITQVVITITYTLQEGTTPLHSAVSNNQVEIASILIEKYNANPTAADFLVG